MNRFIIDGFNLAFRAHYAFNTLMTSTGLMSGCVYGFLNILKSLRGKYHACEFVVAWDNHARRKKELYPEYKANRVRFHIDPPIEDLKNALRTLKVTQVEALNEEADDVIATISQNVDGIVYIYSSDKDLLQLVVDGKIIVIRPKVGTKAERIYDEEAVKNEYSVSPSDLACFLSLRGDTVDNIPGVQRLPSKVIAHLTNSYHTPNKIYENINKEKLTENQLKNLQTAQNQIGINWELVKLKTDLECLYTFGSSNSEEFSKILSKYEIRALSASSYVGLFEKDFSFNLRTAPGYTAVKTFSLFDDLEEK